MYAISPAVNEDAQRVAVEGESFVFRKFWKIDTVYESGTTNNW